MVREESVVRNVFGERHRMPLDVALAGSGLFAPLGHHMIAMMRTPSPSPLTTAPTRMGASIASAARWI
jgi:hypothetical protein